MKIGGIYSFNDGLEAVESRFSQEFEEIKQAIAAIDAGLHKTKISQEKTMPGRKLYKPRTLNESFEREFTYRGWDSHQRIKCDYPTEYYVDNYSAPSDFRGAFREMDFVKNRLGVEVQFGKYAFMVYNVCAKMTIFHKEDIIDVGVEIVPLRELTTQMSTGVSYFEQFVWDLERRGVSDIDIPVLILGIVA